jgi:predicted membrane metal-binding protein
MIFVMKCVRFYALSLAALALIMLAIYDKIPDGFIFLFNIISIPTIPLVSIIFGAFSWAGTDLAILISVIISCVIYAAVSHLCIRAFSDRS